MRWLLFFLAATFQFAIRAEIPAPPAPLREFRGAWVATVAGTDFPRVAGASAAVQKAELLGIIERAAALRLNALIFQVRPAGDAFYASAIEPWSPFLTGAMGRAPEGGWDPLEFAIEQCHERGIELHAWFNPFRALFGSHYSPASTHVMKEHAAWCWKYGSDVWMDPGEPGVRDRAKRVILDVLRRYQVDGIHLDDYFYPYPVKAHGSVVEFPDDRTWNYYHGAAGQMTRAEWRRSNVDTFIQETYTAIKKEKPWVLFGISPFGLWRPNYPEGIGRGALDPYNEIGADSLKWLQKGWCDYFAPQLYWPTKQNNLSFTTLFNWWLSENTAHRHIWPGMASERVLSDRQPVEIVREISVTRDHQLDMPCGHIHWNFSALNRNQGHLADLVNKSCYINYALPPATPWLGNYVPPAPTLVPEKTRVEWHYSDQRSEQYVKWWLVQTYEDGKWKSEVLLPEAEKTANIPLGTKAVAIRGIGLTGLAGMPSIFW